MSQNLLNKKSAGWYCIGVVLLVSELIVLLFLTFTSPDMPPIPVALDEQFEAFNQANVTQELERSRAPATLHKLSKNFHQAKVTQEVQKQINLHHQVALHVVYFAYLLPSRWQSIVTAQLEELNAWNISENAASITVVLTCCEPATNLTALQGN